MHSEYSTVNSEHFDFKILFFGREQTKANYAFSGNNTRDQYVLHLVLKGSGVFSSAGNGIHKIEKREEARGYIQDAFENSRNGRIVIEPFLEGSQHGF
uniref:AraC family ligand binding domain-containing protein n=1 Tax=uncultured Ligilactobacillus sp. TaxID=2837633 RepID=UPI00351D8936